ncbi:MAG: endonuclease [Clostridia bacterium]|nr:endonuclease [Clostridia bacterium]
MKASKTNYRVTFSAILLLLILVFHSISGVLPFLPTPIYAEAASKDTYYDGLNESLTGDAFRAQLADLITETHHTQTTYDGLNQAFKVADADPDKPGNIIWFYSGTSVPFSGFGSSVGTTNREHVWPKNAGKAFPEKSKAGSDAHHLRPTEAQMNSTRGSRSFGEVAQIPGYIVAEGGSTSYENLCYTDGTFFYPGEGFRGATARILMYVQVRWGDEFSLTFVDSAGSNKTIGKISDLMKWHLEEPPTEAEIRRNEAVFGIQGNRNPFIDHPEYAAKIFCYDGESYNAKLQSIVAQYGDAEDRPAPESITLSPATLNMAVGQSTTLSATFTPANANKSLVWSSSNSSVASVKDGVVTAHKSGNVTITATSALDSSVKASISLSVKALSGISVSGALNRTTFSAGEKVDPSGLVVTATYSDGSTASISLSDCQWLDGTTRATTLSQGTTSIICKFGTYEQTISGVTVTEPQFSTITLTRDDVVGGSGAYEWANWKDGDLEGKAYIYTGTKDKFQFNNKKTSYYLYNTTPVTGGIITITITLTEEAENWEIRTSTTPFTQTSGIPSTGTSHGVQTVTTSGTTWTLNTTDPYFAICYKDSGASYIKSIEISCGKVGADTDKHTFGTWVAEKPATCTASGTLGHYYCAHCATYFDQNHKPLSSLTIPAKGHNMGEWVITVPPSTEAGEQTRTCTACGHSEKQSIPPVSTPASAEEFLELVQGLSVKTGSEAEFDAIIRAYQTYDALTAEDKEAVSEAYKKLSEAAQAYNQFAQEANKEADLATQTAITAFSVTLVSFSALLWLLFRKML